MEKALRHIHEQADAITERLMLEKEAAEGEQEQVCQ